MKVFVFVPLGTQMRKINQQIFSIQSRICEREMKRVREFEGKRLSSSINMYKIKENLIKVFTDFPFFHYYFCALLSLPVYPRSLHLNHCLFSMIFYCILFEINSFWNINHSRSFISLSAEAAQIDARGRDRRTRSWKKINATKLKVFDQQTST